MMKIDLKEHAFFASAALIALFSFQGFMLFLVLLMWFCWEDAKWPAFDSDDYDKKMMNGPLKAWNKGN